MIKKEYKLKSVSDKSLFAQLWQSDNNTEAVIILIHGFGEHSSRYNDYVSLFVNENISVFSFDLYGHGKSEGKKGCIQSYEQMLEDIEVAVLKADELFPYTPKYIYGHSMGGNISLNYLINKTNNIAGAIITSPWLKLYNEPNAITKKVVSILKNIVPNVTVDSGLNPAYISTIATEVENYKTDSLNHSRISFRLFDSIVKNGMNAYKNAKEINIPTLMFHGSGDMITLHEASRKAAEANKEYIFYKEYPQMYHELHNDIVGSEMAQYIIDWIKKMN